MHASLLHGHQHLSTTSSLLRTCNRPWSWLLRWLKVRFWKEVITVILHNFAHNDSCSVNTAYDPELSFTVSPRSTTRPLYFWRFASNSAFFKWHMSISEAKWTFAPFVLASSITSFLLLTFVRFHAEMFSNFFPFLVHCCLCCGNFHGLRQRNKFVNQICSELSPFPAIWSSWWVGNDSPTRSLVDSLASRIHASCVLFLLDAPLPQFLLF